MLDFELSPELQELQMTRLARVLADTPLTTCVARAAAGAFSSSLSIPLPLPLRRVPLGTIARAPVARAYVCVI